MRRRLVLVTAATTAMVALAFLVPLALLVRTIAHDRALDSARQQAASLAPVLALTDEVEPIELAVATTEAGADDRLTVFLPDGQVVGHDRAPGRRVELAQRGRAFSADVDGGAEVLVPVALPAGGTAVTRVFVPSSTLDRGVSASWLVLGLLGVGLVALAVVVADRLGRSVTRPVAALADAAGKLGEGDLDAEVDVAGPREIAELGRSFNRMAGRIRSLIAAEREAVADLSHRLRTPLTALRLDAENLPESDDSGHLLRDVDAMDRAVTAVIEEARRPVREGAGIVTDLAAVTRERTEYWGALADDQGRSWSFTTDDADHTVMVPDTDLRVALDAVLGNVFAHTSETAGFTVRVEHHTGVHRVMVEDDGQGFASLEVMTRGVSGGGSTGLGLDIARRTAEAAGGRLRIENRSEGGARVTLEFLPPG